MQTIKYIFIKEINTLLCRCFWALFHETWNRFQLEIIDTSYWNPGWWLVVSRLLPLCYWFHVLWNGALEFKHIRVIHLQKWVRHVISMCLCLCVCVCALVCVCVCACALVWTDIWGHFCVFNRISADTRGVGTSPVVKPNANQRFIYFYTHWYSQCNFLNLPPHSSLGLCIGG